MKSLKLIGLCGLFWAVTAQANVLGEMETFAPNTDGLDFITVHTARPLEKNYFAFSNYLNYAKDHLLVYDNLATQSRMSYANHLTEYDFGLTYAITKTWQVSFMAPFLIDYQGETSNGIHVDVTTGVHSYRPGTKFTFYQDKNNALAALGSIDIPQVFNSPYTGVDAKPIYNLELAYTARLGKFIHGLNVGYRNRQPSGQPIGARMFPLKDQVLASYGLSMGLGESNRFVFELFGSYPLNKDPYNNATDASSLDALFALKHMFTKYLRADGGFTVAAPQKTLSPTYRVFVGLVYYWPNSLWGNEGAAPVAAPTERPQPPAEAPRAEPFTVTPKETSVYAGETLLTKASGGTAPYRYEIASGKGTIDADGLFTAPETPGETLIRVSDSTTETQTIFLRTTLPPKADREIRLTNLEFLTGKDQLNPRSQAELERNVDQLKGLNISNLIVEGHTDDVGSDESNLLLSQRRARTVQRILMERLQLSEDQVKAIGHGESQPLVPNTSAKNRQTNRRVQLRLYFKR